MSPQVHMKGYILQLLLDRGGLWDYEVAEDVMRAYDVSGPYWVGTVRLTLTDLYSGGLLTELDAGADESGDEPKVLFKYAVNEFGRERMEQSGLVGAPR